MLITGLPVLLRISFTRCEEMGGIIPSTAESEMEQSIRRYRSGLFSLLLLGLFLGGPAYAITGTGSGLVRDRLSTSGCGAIANAYYFTLALRTGSKWRMLLDDDTAYTGSFTSDSSGRNLLLNCDATSRDRLIRNLAGWAGYLCELPVSAIGSTSNGSGRANYNAVVSSRNTAHAWSC